jgi:hypothetical protein
MMNADDQSLPAWTIEHSSQSTRSTFGADRFTRWKGGAWAASTSYHDGVHKLSRPVLICVISLVLISVNRR